MSCPRCPLPLLPLQGCSRLTRLELAQCRPYDTSHLSDLQHFTGVRLLPLLLLVVEVLLSIQQLGPRLALPAPAHILADSHAGSTCGSLPRGCCLQLVHLHLCEHPPALVAELPLLRTLVLDTDGAMYAQDASSQRGVLQRLLPQGPYPALQHLCVFWPSIRWAQGLAAAGLG